MNLSIDFDSLTLDEIEILEEVSGLSIDTIGKRLTGDDAPKAKTMKALAFIAARRDDPDVTLDDIGKIKLTELTSGLEVTAQATPTPEIEQ
jgi:hypothetical protein